MVPFESGRPITVRNLPIQVRCLDRRPLPDYQTYHSFRPVSDRFKEVVERIEPNVHQFFPAEYRGKDGSHVADMWFLNICNRLDSVDREHSEPTGMTLHDGRMWMPAFNAPGADRKTLREKYPKPVLYFNNAQIGDTHLWIDKHEMHGPYLSNRMADALLAASLSGVSLVEV